MAVENDWVGDVRRWVRNRAEPVGEQPAEQSTATTDFAEPARASQQQGEIVFPRNGTDRSPT